jgi:YVTN family beta-propeller protein
MRHLHLGFKNMLNYVVPLGLLGMVLWAMPAGAAPFAYVTNEISTVTVLDTASNTVVATVPVEGVPWGVAITPDGAHAYVTNLGSTVTVLDTASNTVVATVPVGAGSQGVAITPDGAHAYVTNEISNDVSVLATATNTVVATVPVGSLPSWVAITPDGAHAYVTNFDSTVSVLATATNTVVATVPVETLPFGVAITPDGAHAYVTNFGSGTVSVLATATNTVVATVPVGSLPVWVAITPGPVSFACPLGQGFWKNHPGIWPVTSLTLGSQTYTQAALLALFDTPPRGDASVILAHQLIAAKLNVANGANPTPISATITDADHLFSSFAGTLPYHVRPSSATGQAMVNDASMLERYNNGELTPDCTP